MSVSETPYRVELETSLRPTGDDRSEMPAVLTVFGLGEAPHDSSFCRWEKRGGCERSALSSSFPNVSGSSIAVVIGTRPLDHSLTRRVDWLFCDGHRLAASTQSGRETVVDPTSTIRTVWMTRTERSSKRAS